MRQTSFSSSSTPWKRRSYTNEKKKIATDTHDAPRLLNRRLDLRVECATNENAPRESHRHATPILCFNVCEALWLRPVHWIFPHSIFLVYIGTRLEKNIRKPQDTTKTYKFDTTINLLYWENKFQEMFIFATKLNHPNPEISFITTWRTNLTHLKCFRL